MISIPYSNASEGRYDMMRAFIKDFIVELRNVFVAEGSKPYMMWKIDALRMQYLWESSNDNNPLDDATIGSVLNKDRESVRKQTEILREECIKMLTENGYDKCGIEASSKMKAEFSSFMSELRPVEMLSVIQEHLNSGEDARTPLFFLEGLGYKCSRAFCVSTSAFGKKGISILNKLTVNGNDGPLAKYFKKESIPLRFVSDVKVFMKTKLKYDDDKCRILEAYLRANTEEYEWDKDETGAEIVAMKWEHLDAVKNKQARIIYDFNRANGWDKIISQDEVFRQYYARNVLHGLNDENTTIEKIERHIHIEFLGNSQYRFLANPNTIRLDISSELEKYVVENSGKVTLDDVTNFVLSINPSYSQNTILQTYVPKANCRSLRIDGNRYVIHKTHKEYKKKRPKQLTIETAIRTTVQILVGEKRPLDYKTELIPLFKKNSGVNTFNGYTLKSMLKKAENELFEFRDDNTIDLLVTDDEATAFPYEVYAPKAPGRKGDGSTKLIRNLAVEQLYYTQGHTMTKKALFDSVKNRFPDNKSKTGIYKVFKDDPIFIETGKKGKGGSYTLDIILYNKEHGINSKVIADSSFDWDSLKSSIVDQMKNPHLDKAVCDNMLGIIKKCIPDIDFDCNNEFWRMLNLLGRYYDNKTSEDETMLLAWMLYLGVEKYLRAYMPIPDVSATGLGEYITILQRKGLFPDRYTNYPVGSVSDEIRRITGMVISIRNGIGHTLNQGYNEKSRLEQSIKMAVKYYLLVAAYHVHLAS